MRILPTDLPNDWLVRLIQLRDGRPGAALPPPRLGFWGRLGSRGSGLDPETAAAAMPAAAQAVTGAVAGIFAVGSPVVLITAMLLFGKSLGPEAGIPLTLLGGFLPLATAAALSVRSLFRRLLTRPLDPEEVDGLLEQAHDELSRRFLNLVRDATPAPGKSETEENLRAALRALGEAIGRLPPLDAEPLDAASLRAGAERLRLQAGETPDRVIAESLERRAQAHLHRAAAHEQSALLLRRSEALRSEIDAQIDALREGLVALQGDSQDHGSLAILASSARTVATEAVNLAAAREELGSRAGAWPATRPSVEAGPEQTVLKLPGG